MELPEPEVRQREEDPITAPLRWIDPAALSGFFTFEEGFHRADWASIYKWIDDNVPLEREEARSEAAQHWVTLLRDDLGAEYYVLVSRRTILLTDLDSEAARWLLDYAGRVSATIKDQLKEVAWGGSLSKDVVLVFSEQDDYYQYVSYYSCDGVQPQSGGLCIHSGYGHIVIPWTDGLDAANAVVHELTHDCLAHLPLPLWLNEGVAVSLERSIGMPPEPLGTSARESVAGALSNWRPPVMWAELAERQFAFWNEENIQSFWAGTSFYEPGDANHLSYSLAEVLVKLLCEQGKIFLRFLQEAHRDDAGQTAALDTLGVDLGEIAATFLGERNWRPRRKAIADRWKAAGWIDADEDSTA